MPFLPIWFNSLLKSTLENTQNKNKNRLIFDNINTTIYNSYQIQRTPYYSEKPPIQQPVAVVRIQYIFIVFLREFITRNFNIIY